MTARDTYCSCDASLCNVALASKHVRAVLIGRFDRCSKSQRLSAIGLPYELLPYCMAIVIGMFELKRD